MTLPTEITLPLRTDYSNEDMDRYLRDLVFEIQGMYESVANNVNGFIRSNADIDHSNWTPTVAGTGGGGFTYAAGGQIGWSIRKGIFTELFFDVEWTATTATGNLYVQLPYKVTKSGRMPFVGILQPSVLTFPPVTSSLVINAIPDTYRGEIWAVRSALGTTNVAVVGAGRLIGNIRYIGTEEE